MSDTPNKTPIADLRADALRHYDEMSMKEHSWLSVIPRAINYYYDAEEAREAVTAPLGAGDGTTTATPLSAEAKLAEIEEACAAYYGTSYTEYFADIRAEHARLSAAVATSQSERERESARLRESLCAALARETDLRQAGWRLSNLAYNIAQSDVLTPEMRRLLTESRERWDRVLNEHATLRSLSRAALSSTEERTNG